VQHHSLLGQFVNYEEMKCCECGPLATKLSQKLHPKNKIDKQRIPKFWATSGSILIKFVGSKINRIKQS
jgi:hypothetical protein